MRRTRTFAVRPPGVLPGGRPPLPAAGLRVPAALLAALAVVGAAAAPTGPQRGGGAAVRTVAAVADGPVRAARPGSADGEGGPVPAGPRVPVPPDDGAGVGAGTRTAPAARGRAAEAAAGSADSLDVSSSTRTIAPGVTLTRERTVDPAGFLDGYVLRADLDGPTRPRLLAPTVSGTSAPTALADGAGAAAAVNGDFFAIDTTNAPIGPEVRDGALLKAGAAPAPVAGVGQDGVGRIADLLLEGAATVGGVRHDLAGLNPGSVPADALALYTPDWGPGDRRFAVPAGADAVELEVRDGRVAAVHEGAGRTPVPDGAQVLLATGSTADALARTAPGTPAAVEYHARTSAPSPFSLALGAHLVLVRGGAVAPVDTSDAGNSALKPRTAMGWTADRRLVLYVADGSSSRSRGLTALQLAERMRALGAVDAVMLDGGGSSQLVARRPGGTGAEVVNAPSDGAQRVVPNAVGLVPPAGSGRLHGIDVRLRSDRLFPGLSRDVAASGYDEALGAAPLGAARWRTVPGGLARSDGAAVLRGARPGSGTLEARSGAVSAHVPLRVLGPLDRLEADVPALSLEPGDFRDVTVTGRDAEGFAAPVEPRDVHLEYDPAVASVAARPDGTLRVTGLPGGDGRGTVVTATVQGRVLRLPVTVGLADTPLDPLADASAWSAAGAKATASVSSVATGDRPGAAPGERGLRLAYDMTGQPTGTSAAYAVARQPLAVPAGAQRLALWVRGDGSGHWLRAQLRSQGTTNVPFTFSLAVDWTGWRRVEGPVPTGFTAPLTLERLYLVQTDPTRRTAGAVDLALLDARVGVRLDLPDRPDQPDPAVVEDADGLPAPGRWAWRFAVLSDTHVNADGGTGSYAYRHTARALDEIAAARPDLVLLSGDGVDQDRPADFALFQRLLTEHLPAGVPLYWAVGNHESGAVAGGTLEQFTASTGRPTRQSFDHAGTRFVLLDSTLGSLRLSDWSQLGWLRERLADAASDPAVDSVVVAVHHPVLDPTGTGASQLSDPSEGALLEQWLADFRRRTGKQVALVTGHAHTAHVRRADGLLEFNAPVVGKTPYGDAGHGGFAAWSLVTLDPEAARVTPDRPDPRGAGWFRAEVRPLLDRIGLAVPPQLSPGDSGQVSATAVDDGMGGRTVPLRYPATAAWSGAHLAVVADDRALAAALRRPGVVAVLDRRTLRLTAVRPGGTDVTVRSGSLTASARVEVGAGPAAARRASSG
ncbi:phosphodiester glycosidase family protein [Streptacidiphilus sp. ASG 303]|uniref:phosphodiester glycosidase family protein n=1 Tax=Streptacidiphilus sp. ASG 303 TaxID=2896847 RepID=UPI001E361284|nr:phosphodiester glycosidase family protein [Streptacidiphilus sp. ASG 303]MCD0481062.1 phosphodiester glycosidase family protein [Streptacidiphilus sp. ASG 303]